MSAILFELVSKSFGAVKAVQGCDLAIEDGSFVAILGPSGCGKTTLLRMLGGFLRPDSGRILLGRKDITHLPPFRRNLGFVFQSYALFPHLTIAENLAFGLKMRGLDATAIAERVAHYLELVRLGAARDRYPDQLSGGQQQRVAVGRALFAGRPVFIGDEPVSSVDEYQAGDIAKIITAAHETVVLALHDIDLALATCDRIVGLQDGKIVLDAPAITLTPHDLAPLYRRAGRRQA